MCQIVLVVFQPTIGFTSHTGQDSSTTILQWILAWILLVPRGWFPWPSTLMSLSAFFFIHNTVKISTWIEICKSNGHILQELKTHCHRHCIFGRISDFTLALILKGHPIYSKSIMVVCSMYIALRLTLVRNCENISFSQMWSWTLMTWSMTSLQRRPVKACGVHRKSSLLFCAVLLCGCICISALHLMLYYVFFNS